MGSGGISVPPQRFFKPPPHTQVCAIITSPFSSPFSRPIHISHLVKINAVLAQWWALFVPLSYAEAWTGWGALTAEQSPNSLTCHTDIFNILLAFHSSLVFNHSLHFVPYEPITPIWVNSWTRLGFSYFCFFLLPFIQNVFLPLYRDFPVISHLTFKKTPTTISSAWARSWILGRIRCLENMQAPGLTSP